jgi:hypothetical protein
LYANIAGIINVIVVFARLASSFTIFDLTIFAINTNTSSLIVVRESLWTASLASSVNELKFSGWVASNRCAIGEEACNWSIRDGVIWANFTLSFDVEDLSWAWFASCTIGLILRKMFVVFATWRAWWVWSFTFAIAAALVIINLSFRLDIGRWWWSRSRSNFWLWLFNNWLFNDWLWLSSSGTSAAEVGSDESLRVVVTALVWVSIIVVSASVVI